MPYYGNKSIFGKHRVRKENLVIPRSLSGLRGIGDDVTSSSVSSEESRANTTTTSGEQNGPPRSTKSSDHLFAVEVGKAKNMVQAMQTSEQSDAAKSFTGSLAPLAGTTFRNLPNKKAFLVYSIGDLANRWADMVKKFSIEGAKQHILARLKNIGEAAAFQGDIGYFRDPRMGSEKTTTGNEFSDARVDTPPEENLITQAEYDAQIKVFREKMEDSEAIERKAKEKYEKKIEALRRLKEDPLFIAKHRPSVFTLDTPDQRIIKLRDGRTLTLLNRDGSGWMEEAAWRSWYAHKRHVGEHDARPRARAAQAEAVIILKQAVKAIRQFVEADLKKQEAEAKAVMRASQLKTDKERQAIGNKISTLSAQAGIDKQKLAKKAEMEGMLEKLKQKGLSETEFLKIKAEFEGALVQEGENIEEQTALTKKRAAFMSKIQAELKLWAKAHPYRKPARRSVYTGKGVYQNGQFISFDIPSGSWKVVSTLDPTSGWMLDYQRENWHSIHRKGHHRRARERQILYNTEANGLMTQAIAAQTMLNDQWIKDEIAAKEAYIETKGEEIDKILPKYEASGELLPNEFLKVKEDLGRANDKEKKRLQDELVKETAKITYPRVLSEGIVGGDAKDKFKILMTADQEVYRMVDRGGSGWMVESEWQNWWKRNKDGEHRSAAKHAAGYTARADALMEGESAEDAQQASREGYREVSHAQNLAQNEKGIRKLGKDVSVIAKDVAEVAMDMVGGKDNAIALAIGIAALAILVPLIVIILKGYLGRKGVDATDTEVDDMANTIVQRRQTDIGGVKAKLEKGDITDEVFRGDISAITINEADKIMKESADEEAAKKSAGRKKMAIMGGAGVAGLIVVAGGIWAAMKLTKK